MLDKAKSNPATATQAEKPTSSAYSTESQTNSKDASIEYQQQHRLQGQQEDTEESLRQAMLGSNLMMDEHVMLGSFWLNDSGSPCFSNVDQLLSPGFSVPEHVFQSYSMGYDGGIEGTYDQLLSSSNGGPVDLLYNV